MSMIKRLWKRGTRRHPSPNTVDDRHSGSSRPDDAPTMPSAASSSSSLAGAVEGAPLAAQQQQQQQRQQEALIAALQSTVLEQRRRLEGMDATLSRLHGEARRQGFHVEALQRLLHQLTAADQSAEEQEGLEGVNAAASSLSSSSTTSLRLLRGVAEEAQPRRLAGGLAATPAPPMWGPGAAGGATGADMPAEGEEGGGLYSYISGFLGGAASTLLLPAAAAAGGGASEGQGEEQQGQSEAQQPSKSVQIADAAAYGRLTPAGGRMRVDLEDAQALLMSQILEASGRCLYVYTCRRAHAGEQFRTLTVLNTQSPPPPHPQTNRSCTWPRTATTSRRRRSTPCRHSCGSGRRSASASARSARATRCSSTG